MSSLKIKNLALALAVTSSASIIASCGTVDYLTSDDSLRTPSGYYEHANSKEIVDPLKVPDGLKTPYFDHSLDIPDVQPTQESRAMVGEAMDVRSPVVSQVGELGVEVIPVGNKANAWFLPHGELAVTSKEQAWAYLNAALNFLHIGVAETRPADMILATDTASFTQYGSLYDTISEDYDVPQYNLMYKVEVIESSQGQVGYLVELARYSSEDNHVLNAVESSNLNVGFANTLVTAMALQNRTVDVIPDYVSPVLGRDNNNRDAIIIDAPYQATWDVMRGVLSQYGMEIKEFSISRSSIKFELDEQDAQFYTSQGVEPFGLADGEYAIRVAVAGKNSLITFYDEDDKPLNASQVAALYPGLSKAIAKEFMLYKQDPANYLAKFAVEE